MSSCLSELLPLLASARDGIKKLRGLILELAVRGRLVPQDPNDEPAGELLKRIEKERARLEADGICKKLKPVLPVGQDEQPFMLPNGWRWVRLSQIGHDWGQKTPEETFTYIDVSAIDNAFGIIDAPTVIAPEDAPSRARKLVQRGTVIYSTVRPYLLNIAVVDRDFTPDPIASTAFAILHPLAEISSQYIFWYLRSPVFVRYVESVQTGIAYPAVNDSQFFSGPFPLPPLAEQHRIVAKVDELMALCDRLEAEQTDAEAVHARLVETLIGTLTQSTDAAELAANWQRLAEHFDTLFTTEASLDTLKQTILQLAVMGKLVPQDPNDEPASELLKRIARERARRESEGTCNKLLVSPPVAISELPFSAPEEWKWRRLDELLAVSGGVTLGRKLADRNVVSRPYLRVANVQRGKLLLDHMKSLEVPVVELARYRLQSGDLLITEGGDWDKVGRTAIWRGEIAECLHQNHVFRARPLSAEWCSRWTEMYLNADPARTYFAASSKQTTNLASINMKQLKSCPFPVPPLSEQHRIVAKVDELMALCDRLKADLAESRARQQRLATTLIESALEAA